MIKIFIKAMALLLFFNLVSCGYSNQNCIAGNPNDSQTFDPDNWIAIYCNAVGDQFFTSNINYSWKSIQENGNQFFASGDITKNSTKKINVFPSKFTNIYTREADIVTKKNLNKMLNKGIYSDQLESFENIKLIRLLTNAGFSYEVAIFVKEDASQWVLICKTYCNNDEPIILRTIKTEAAH